MHTSWLLGRSLLQLDRPEAVTKYKLVIPAKRIMILVFWEKSFKSKKTNYSNRLARSLVASCKGISSSLWIQFDKIESPHQRWQFLGTQKIGNPKSMTQLDATRPLRPCLIGICKDMMSSMDPLREAGLQDEVARTSLVTRKVSSSIFCWKILCRFQEDEGRNTKCKP